MKKTFIFVFLLSFVYQFASAKTVMEAGTWQYRYSLDDEFKKQLGAFIPTLDILDFSLIEATTKAPNFYQNTKRFFYIDDKGYTVIGSDVPKIIKERNKLGEGDLIINGNIHVMGDIYGDYGSSATVTSTNSDDISQLKEEVKRLRQEIEALKKSAR